MKLACEEAVYRAWVDMKRRCYNPKCKSYKNYGMRGITVCARWMRSFENFRIDMGPKPEGTTLDRKDNEKGYSKGNCRWATYTEQLLNRRNTRYVEHNGESLPISILATRHGMPPKMVRDRIDAGMSVADAISRPKALRFARIQKARKAK